MHVWLLHVVLDELLDFVAGVFVLCESHAAVFKLVSELRRAEQNDSSANRRQRGERSRGSAAPAAQICSLCLDVVALEEGLGVGVSKAVVVPERAGGLQKLCLRSALVISKEPWGENPNWRRSPNDKHESFSSPRN